MSSSKHWLSRAGWLVLALTNAIILSHVAYNRESSPDSVLLLTDRELMPQWSSTWPNEENGNMSLQLLLRAEGAPNAAYSPQEQWLRLWPNVASGPIAWLDEKKLAALGIGIGVPPTAPGSDAHYAGMSGRNVYLVLELDGPARARALQAARDEVARLQRVTATDPQQRAAQMRLRSAQAALLSEEDQSSRLFIVDAGLDRSSLRRRYFDRTRYAIVRGRVKPVVVHYGPAQLYGSVSSVRPASIYVPLECRADLSFGRPEDVWIRSMSGEGKRHFTIRLVFGSLLEPWIASAHAGAI